MEKEQLKKLNEGIDKNFEVEKCYRELCDKLGFIKKDKNEKKNPQKPNKSIICFSLVLIVFILGTFVITRAAYLKPGSYDYKVIVSSDELIAEANENIKKECDKVNSLPIISFFVENYMFFNVYQAKDTTENKNVFYYQIICSIKDYEAIKIETEFDNANYDFTISSKKTLKKAFEVAISNVETKTITITVFYQAKLAKSITTSFKIM